MLLQQDNRTVRYPSMASGLGDMATPAAAADGEVTTPAKQDEVPPTQPDPETPAVPIPEATTIPGTVEMGSSKNTGDVSMDSPDNTNDDDVDMESQKGEGGVGMVPDQKAETEQVDLEDFLDQPPPEKLTAHAINQRLRRVMQPRRDGTYLVPECVRKQWKDLETRAQVMALFEKSGNSAVTWAKI